MIRRNKKKFLLINKEGLRRNKREKIVIFWREKRKRKGIN
jgi:hypothetical protein